MKRFFSIVLALALVAAWMPMNSITAYAWTSLPTELNGFPVVWETDDAAWTIHNGNIRCPALGGEKFNIKPDGTCARLYDSEGNPVTHISQLTVGTYQCEDEHHRFTLSAPAPQSQPKTGVMDTLPLWFAVCAVSACAYVLTSKKKVF